MAIGRLGGHLDWLDVLAPEITLRFQGKRGIRTGFGIMLTIMYVLTLGASAYIITMSYFKTDAPLVVVENIEEVENHKVDVLNGRLLPVLFVLKDEAIYTPAADVPKYFTIIMTKYKFRSTVDKDGSAALVMSKVQMPLIPCAELKSKYPLLFEHYKDAESTPLYQKTGDKFGLCVQADVDETYVAGGGSSPDTDVLIIQVFPCTLSDGSCAPASEIARFSIIPALPATSLSISNYQSPKSTILQFEYSYYLNPALKQKYQYKFSNQELYDDSETASNLFQSKKLHTKYFFLDKSLISNNMRQRSDTQTNCNYSDISSGICQAYIHFEFFSSAKTVRTIRVYKSLTSVLSALGGINSILFILFYYANLAYCHFAKEDLLVQSIFPFLNEKQKSSCFSSTLTRCLCKCKKNRSDTPNTDLPEGYLADLPAEDRPWLRKKAYESIMNSLDIISIVKELHTVKVLSRLLLREYHIPLTPILALYLNDSTDDLPPSRLDKTSGLLHIMTNDPSEPKRLLPKKKIDKQRRDEKEFSGALTKLRTIRTLHHEGNPEEERPPALGFIQDPNSTSRIDNLFLNYLCQSVDCGPHGSNTTPHMNRDKVSLRSPESPKANFNSVQSKKIIKIQNVPIKLTKGNQQALQRI